MECLVLQLSVIEIIPGKADIIICLPLADSFPEYVKYNKISTKFEI